MDTNRRYLARQKGLVAQHVGRSIEPSSTEYVYVTVWEDVDSVKAFAGEQWQQAVITPEDEHLIEDSRIGHYKVIAS